MTAGSPSMTAEELLQLPSGRAHYELVDGELRVMTPAGHVHGKVAMRIGLRLAAFVETHDLGTTYAAETGFLLGRSPDTVRAPDAAFVTASRLAETRLSPDGYFPGAPDLAIEVVSPSDTPMSVLEKAHAWLRAGCLVVVVLDPADKTATVSRSADRVTTLAEPDHLAIPDLLPGWSVSLRELFA